MSHPAFIGVPEDRRTRPGNGNVRLEGRDDLPGRPVRPMPARIAVPMADLLPAPGGVRDRQLPFGERFDVLERRDGHAFGLAARDGSVGWVWETSLGPDAAAPTHRVSALASHAYAAADFKSRVLLPLPHGAMVDVTDDSGGYAVTAAGHVPLQHLTPIGTATDPVAAAEALLGVPYLWGGNGPEGIDCSGLVQCALRAAGRDCPADSDQQRHAFGGDPGAAARRGDLIFWKGHVAMARGDGTMIHANAHAMAVAIEDMADGIARIEAQGDGPVIALGRL